MNKFIILSKSSGRFTEPKRNSGEIKRSRREDALLRVSVRGRTCWHMFRLKSPWAAPGEESLNLWGPRLPGAMWGPHVYAPTRGACTHTSALVSSPPQLKSPHQWRSQYVNQFVCHVDGRREVEIPSETRRLRFRTTTLSKNTTVPKT